MQWSDGEPLPPPPATLARRTGNVKQTDTIMTPAQEDAALHRCLKKADIKGAKSLLRASERSVELANARNRAGASALIVAIKAELGSMVRLLRTLPSVTTPPSAKGNGAAR